MKFIGSTEEYLHLTKLEKQDYSIINETIEGSLTILWFERDANILIVDGKQYTFNKNEIVFLTEFHQVRIDNLEASRLVRFNRSFYCVTDHDTEVGCNGILFFGASQLPKIKIPEKDLERFETLWKMFSIEMQSKDSLQIDMLQMMLTRYLILCTRIFKLEENYPHKKVESDIIRDFNFLVEQHFKTKHSVAEYAELLNKSPKTLSNIFSKLGSKTPLQYIKERKMLEAKRRLRYTDMQIQEIAYEIGYDDVQAFSRFFKTQEGVSPSLYKEKRT